MSKLIHNYTFWLFIVACLMLFSHLDVIEVNIMEARNFITAREMATNHHWILTTINDMPRYEKPPLPTWLTAISGIIFGFDCLFGMRLPVVFITLLLVFGTFKLSEKLGLSKKQSFHNGLILITSFYIYFAGRDNQWDMYTHSFMMICILFLWEVLNEQKKLLFNAIMAGLFFGLSFLSKGPISVYALLLPFLIAYGFTYKFQLKNKKLYLILVVVLGIIIGLSWPLYVKWADPATYLKVTKIESSRWGNYNTRPFYYYWSFFTQSGIWTVPAFIALLYPYLKNKVSNLKAYQFTLIWTLASVVLLSIVPEKKSRYLLPVLIPMALNTGFYIEYLINNFKNISLKKEKGIIYFAFGLIGIICIVIPVGIFIKVKNDIAGFEIWFLGLTLSLFGIGYVLFTNLRNKNFAKVFYAVIAVQVTVVVFGIPFTKLILKNPDYASAKAIRDSEKSLAVKTYELNSFTPEIIWDYGYSMPILLNNETNKLNLPLENKFGLLVTDIDSINSIKELKNYTLNKVSNIDLNHIPKDSKKHNIRLTRTYYIVSKK
ncbi:glycosyltransferase family 39 protein [Flavobacterium sp. IMCC34518]|uniref:ArnT family glycosyltransferase n=1 Tax=Flavobacterium sp. IMCC34518 TaxID=3003623 RepID=UPI0024831638|nr:glycosyltransferase family 39 protein [Flavobacterium sp. IMCC34518]